MSGIIGEIGSRSRVIGTSQQIKTGSFTANMNAAPSTAITGLGFKPNRVDFVASNDGLNGISYGFDFGGVGGLGQCRAYIPTSSAYANQAYYSFWVAQQDNSNKVLRGWISTFGTDGFTVFQQLTDYPHTANGVTINYTAYKY